MTIFGILNQLIRSQQVRGYFGEKPELIVDPATTKNLMVNYPHVIQAKLLADDEYIRTHKHVDSRYSKLAAKANSSV